MSSVADSPLAELAAPAGGPLQDAILDAAEDCFRRFGVAQTTMDDVVRAAKVPRATVYRHAGGKNELIVGVVMRELSGFLVRLAQHLSRYKKLEDLLVESVLFAVEEGRNSELLRPLLGQDARSSTDAVFAALEPLRDQVAAGAFAFAKPIVDGYRQAGHVRSELSDEDAAEWLARTVASFITLPDVRNRSTKELRKFLHRTLVPVFMPDNRR